ncbi:MAG TPA: M20/M25/M40 family metallo-hydrolase [Pyrinomonadaceae bacterium]|jgi:Zn-dependent M28 family amino/carboxypeptidase|nr:M20/M25/M40 family metallo-hydrolase [Pyrinomonadaceae bacterium]
MNSGNSRPCRIAILVLAAAALVFAPVVIGQGTKTATTVTEQSVRQYMGALASDDMRGRGSATADELAAAKYIASQLKSLKIEPAGDNGDYLQTVKFTRRARGAPADAPAVEQTTINVLAIMRGSDPKLSKETVLLSAHLDHLGVRPNLPGDNIFNGADDDASGVTAVLELAQALAEGPKPKRTVVFALFGSEEIGGYGARYFQEHPPVPIETFVANLEFEMIARPDSAVAADTLWLTGYERSNLGPELARHGAKLVADPHPEQNFFRRSDNFVLARQGIIAHTVSSFGLHTDYHRPSDDLSHVDFKHMTDAIASMIEPVRWLVNSDFKPQWNDGGRPQE